MITGDHAQSARRIASRLGISTLHASVLPDAKAGIIEALRREGRHVAMVGDGINDAPALACADLGIALGTGTDVARHTAAITLVGRGLARVPDALVIARRTRHALRQNLFLAFAYNVIGIPLAMAGMLNPMIAGAAMAASSLSVVANALRLNRWRPRAHTIPGPSPV
jgi:Cu+-exporting ATPase